MSEPKNEMQNPEPDKPEKEEGVTMPVRRPSTSPTTSSTNAQYVSIGSVMITTLETAKKNLAEAEAQLNKDRAAADAALQAWHDLDAELNKDAGTFKKEQPNRTELERLRTKRYDAVQKMIKSQQKYNLESRKYQDLNKQYLQTQPASTQKHEVLKEEAETLEKKLKSNNLTIQMLKKEDTALVKENSNVIGTNVSRPEDQKVALETIQKQENDIKNKINNMNNIITVFEQQRNDTQKKLSAIQNQIKELEKIVNHAAPSPQPPASHFNYYNLPTFSDRLGSVEHQLSHQSMNPLSTSTPTSPAATTQFNTSLQYKPSQNKPTTEMLDKKQSFEKFQKKLKSLIQKHNETCNKSKKLEIKENTSDSKELTVQQHNKDIFVVAPAHDNIRITFLEKPKPSFENATLVIQACEEPIELRSSSIDDIDTFLKAAKEANKELALSDDTIKYLQTQSNLNAEKYPEICKAMKKAEEKEQPKNENSLKFN